MAGKTKINGTAYTIKGGKTKIGGTLKTISKGITKIGGTAKTISFITYTSWSSPRLTSNGTIGGSSFATQASSEIDGTRKAWRAFDNSNSDPERDCWHSVNSLPQWLEFYNPVPISINTIVMTNRATTANYLVKTWKLQYSDNNSNWTDLGGSRTQANGVSVSTTYNINAQSQLHKYWRLYITDIYQNGLDNYYVTIGELKVTGWTQTS